MAKSYKLIFKNGPTGDREFTLEQDVLFLGRDVNNDIVIDDSEVSRRHARLSRQGEDYVYEDLGSTNGSFILGQRIIAPTLLTPGTQITIGERVGLVYLVEEIDPSATVVVSRITPQSANVPSSQPIMTPPSIPPAYTPPHQPEMSSASAALTPPPPLEMSSSHRKISKGAVILLIILAVILVFCIIPWIIVDLTNSYCALFPGFFNSIRAGTCL
jgi:pSer/pThr/pTyr-binding forkhead associated (FHA) protein